MAGTPGQTPEPPQASTSSSSPPKYVPQFSAATEMILKRINSGATPVSGGLSGMGLTSKPEGWEDMKKSVLQGMKTTFNIEITTPAKYNTTPRNRQSSRSGSAPGTSAGGNARVSTPRTNASGGKEKGSAKGKGAKAGNKRKRSAREDSVESEDSGNMSGLVDDSDSGDDADSVTDLPKITQSGRQVVKPTQFIPAAAERPRKRGPTKRNQEQALCKRCGRGHSPQSNMIVFCDGCNLGWHQKCHEPHISEDELKDEDAPWFCVDCSRKRGLKTTPSIDIANRVSGADKTSEGKRAYFATLPHAQLVSLLMHATTLHPNIPLFPCTANSGPMPAPPIQAYIPPRPQQAPPPPMLERRTHMFPQQPFPPSATTTSGLFSRAEANPNATINFIRKIPSPYSQPNLPPYLSSIIRPSPPIQSPPLPVQPPTPSFMHSSSAPPTLPPQQTNGMVNGNAGDSRESTPASPPYPKAGQGLMAKLGADEDDMEWLVDQNDFDAFSHVVYGEDGQKVEENGVVL